MVNDGGPAFPNDSEISTKSEHGSWYVKTKVHYEGMSVRVWLAGMAMQGLVAIPHNAPDLRYEKNVAEWAFRYADAMIERMGVKDEQ